MQWVIHGAIHSPFYELFEKIENINADVEIETHYPISRQFLKCKVFPLSNILSGESFIEIYRCFKYFNLKSKKRGTDISKVIDDNFRSEEKLNRTMQNNDLYRFLYTFCKKIEPEMNAFAKNSNTEPIAIEMFTRFFWNDNKPYSYLKPKKDLQEEVNHLSEKFKNTIGLHIRRDDHPDAKAFSTTDKFIKTIQDALEKEASTTFFLASDSPSVKEELIQIFGKDKIMTRQTQYNKYHRNHAKDAVVDLFCLSKTKKVCGSAGSTFSLLASEIGDIELSTVM